MTTSVFHYKDPALYLRNVWGDIKKRNPRYSLRAWANSLGMPSHALIFQIINGKRKITLTTAKKISKYLKHDELQNRYFQKMIELSKCNDSLDIEKIQLEMKFLSNRGQTAAQSLSDYDMQKEPLNYFILELADLICLPNEPTLIKSLLKISYSEIEIKNSIALLLNRKYLTISPKGHLVRSTNRFIFSESETSVSAIQQYHVKNMFHAIEAISKQSPDCREFSGIVLNINLDQISEIKNCLRDFLKSFVAQFDAPNEQHSSTYQFNMQLFQIAEKTQLINNIGNKQ